MLIVVAAYAQDSIQLCGVDLHLGMAKDKTLQSIGESCEIKQLDRTAGDAYCIQPHGDKRLPPYDCSTLQFQEDKLVAINREIKSLDSDTAADLMNALFLVVREAEQRHETITVLTQREFEHDGYRYRTLSFFIGGKMVDLDITQPVGIPNCYSSVALIEILYGDPPKNNKKNAK